MGLQTAGLSFAHPLNNCIFTACEYLFRWTLSVKPLRNLPVIKRLRQKCWIPFITNSSSLYTSPFTTQTSDFLEKLGLIFLHNFHRKQFATIENKVIPQNLCKNFSCWCFTFQYNHLFIGTRLCSTAGSVSDFRYLSKDSGIVSLIPALSPNFLEIEHEINSVIILHWRFVRYKWKCVLEVLANCLVGLPQEKKWFCEMTIPTLP